MLKNTQKYTVKQNTKHSTTATLATAQLKWLETPEHKGGYQAWV